MSKLAIFMVEGCEEIEGLTVVDILRRAKIDIDMISIADTEYVTSSHRVTFKTDKKLSETDLNEYDGVILPGGMPGTEHLRENAKVIETVQTFYEKGKLVAAICAAPTVFGTAGILNGKTATCYPGMEDGLTGATHSLDHVVVDKNIITSRGLGTALEFGLAILQYLTDKDTADAMAKKIVWK